MPNRIPKTIALTVAIAALLAAPAAAQTPSPQRPIVEVGAGWAGFVDESSVDHAIVGGGLRWFVAPRLAIGPEVTYMRGPDRDRDWLVTGNATIDLRNGGAALRAMPYIVAGGGVMQSTLGVGTGTYSNTEGAFTAGIGTRIASGRWHIAPEFRIGWEPHLRIGVQIGWR